MVDRLVEMVSQDEVCEGAGEEVIEGLVETAPERKVSEGRGEVLRRLIEMSPKCEVGEGFREIVQRVVERIT